MDNLEVDNYFMKETLEEFRKESYEEEILLDLIIAYYSN